jgi:tRNA threonylcarbamoyladenosine biosynthesis protein TsaB
MLILAVDTTTFWGSVALLEDSRLLGEVNLESPTTFSERLLPSVELLLKFSHRSLKEIDGYAVAVGPGSFTGIRIGLSTIKALAYSSGKLIAPVSTLEGLAWKLRDSGYSLVAPVIDAKKGEVYAALYEFQAEELNEIISPGAYRPDFFFSRLPKRKTVAFIGNGINIYQQKIQEFLGTKACFPARSFFIAYEVGQLGFNLLQAGKGLTPHGVQPLYLRKSQAEE